MEWRIPLADIDFDEAEETAVMQVVKSRWLTMGANTVAFEEEFAEYTGAKHAIAVANGTAALHLACMAAGIGPGDEVITPSLTFVATANAIRYTGASPVFADIESLDDLDISLSSIERSVTGRTRAIMVMHYAGYPCDMVAITQFAKAHNLIVIEDAAHASGAEIDGRDMGTWGQVGCFSFFSNKNMTTGEGGMVTTNDDETAAKLRILRSHGMTTMSWDRHRGHAWSYDVVDLGYNYRIDEIRAALGRVQLSKLSKNNERRRMLTALYREQLYEMVPEVIAPFKEPRGVPSSHIMPILLPEGYDRLHFMERMKSFGIQTSIHYPPIHKFKIYADGGKSRWELPLTDAVVKREVTIPLYPTMSEDDVLLVVQGVRDSLYGHKDE